MIVDEEVLALTRLEGLDLVPDSLVLDDSGSDFIVFHAVAQGDEQWILRIPRRPEVASRIHAEKLLLDLVRTRLSVNVPQWEVCGPELIAYRTLRGVPAAIEDPVKHEMRWQISQVRPPDAYIAGLGQIMATLQSMPLNEVELTGIPTRTPTDIRAVFAERLARGKSELGMHEAWYARGHRWLAEDMWWPRRTVLIHGDLHPGHTLVNSDGVITGILDWSDAEIGDPGQEFIECARKFPVETVERILTAFESAGGLIWTGMRENIREGIAFAPLYLGLIGIDTDQARYVERGRRGLQQPAGGV